MKSEYKTPTILVEDLEIVDVLLESKEEEISSLKEHENRYGSFASFVINEVMDWF